MSKKVVDIGTQTTAKLIEGKIGHAVGVSPIPQESTFNGGHTYYVGAVSGGDKSTAVLNFNGELYVLPDETKKFYRMTGDIGCWDDTVLTTPYPINIHETSLLVFNNPVTGKNEIHILGGYGYKSKAHYKWDGASWSVASELPYDFCGGKAIIYGNAIHIFGGGTNHYSSANADGYLNYHYKWDGASWEKASSPSFNMKGGTPVVFNNAIWMIGNINTSNSRKIYSFSNGKWSSQSDIPSSLNGVSDASIAVINNAIHVVGGNNAAGTRLSTHLTYMANLGWANGESIPADALCDSSKGMTVYNNSLWLVGYRAFALTTTGTWLAYQDIGYGINKGVVASIDAINGERLVFFNGSSITPIETLTGVKINTSLPCNVSPNDIVVKSPNGDIHIIVDTGKEIKHYKYIKSIEGGSVVYTLSSKLDSLPKRVSNISAGFYNGKLYVFGSYSVGYNHFVLEDDGWKAVSTAPFDAANSKIITVGSHLYAFVTEATTDSKTVIKVAEFNGGSWGWIGTNYEMDTTISSVSLISFQNKLHVIFLDKDKRSRHLVFSGSSYCEYDILTYTAYVAVAAVVRNNSIHIFGTDGKTTTQYLVDYAISNKKGIQVYLPKGHQIICDKNKIVPIYGIVEETDNGYVTTDSGLYHFLVTSDNIPIYSIV